MSTKIRGAKSTDGSGWAVLDEDLQIKPGRWENEEEARDLGLLGYYLLSGVHVAFINEDGKIEPDPVSRHVVIQEIIDYFSQPEPSSLIFEPGQYPSVDVALGGVDHVIAVLKAFQNKE